jgi:hypothetical protein
MRTMAPGVRCCELFAAQVEFGRQLARERTCLLDLPNGVTFVGPPSS